MPERRPTVYERYGKRTADVVVGSLLLVLTAPVQAMVALGVLLDLGRPVIFRQARVTKGGREFIMYKFRSMREPDPMSPPAQYHCAEDDPRHTAYGRFIRRFSLDELPQLLNVLKGDMSLIGPRPEQVEVAAKYGLVNHPRHLVRPGITGPWQVSRFRHGFVHKHAHLDTEYVGRLTFRRDLTIALRTIVVLVVGKRRPRPHPDPMDEPRGDRPLRLLHVLEPSRGGVPSYVDRLGRELAARGVEQIVVTSDRCPVEFGWATAVHRERWRRRHVRDTLAVAARIRDLTESGEVDVVHAHATFAGVAARLRRHHARLVYQPHGWGHLSTRRRGTALFAKAVERALAPRVDLLLTLSHAEAEQAPPVRASALVLPVCDLDKFQPPDEERRRVLREQLGWSEHEIVHICVGELTHRKNQIELVERWLDHAQEPHRLVLVGDGPQRPPAHPESPAPVEVLGWRDDVAEIMQAADCELIASRGEGFSLVILEALATGLPVFMTAAAGLGGLSRDDGVVCSSVDEVVRTALCTSLVPSTARARAERARRHVREASIQRMADDMCRMYRGLLPASAPPQIIDLRVVASNQPSAAPAAALETHGV